jgi:hypothetical protein
MWRRRHYQPKVFALLTYIHHFPARQSLLKIRTTCAYFTKYIGIILSLDDFQSLPNKTLSKMVDNTGNLHHVNGMLLWGLRLNLPSAISGILSICNRVDHVPNTVLMRSEPETRPLSGFVNYEDVMK